MHLGSAGSVGPQLDFTILNSLNAITKLSKMSCSGLSPLGFREGMRLREGVWSKVGLGMELEVKIFVVLLLLRKRRMFWHFDMGILMRALSTWPCHTGLITTFHFSGNETDVNNKIWGANKGKSGKKWQGESEMQIRMVGGPGETSWCCRNWHAPLLSALQGSLVGLFRAAFYNMVFHRGVGRQY